MGGRGHPVPVPRQQAGHPRHLHPGQAQDWHRVCPYRGTVSPPTNEIRRGVTHTQ